MSDFAFAVWMFIALMVIISLIGALFKADTALRKEKADHEYAKRINRDLSSTVKQVRAQNENLRAEIARVAFVQRGEDVRKPFMGHKFNTSTPERATASMEKVTGIIDALYHAGHIPEDALLNHVSRLALVFTRSKGQPS